MISAYKRRLPGYLISGIILLLLLGWMLLLEPGAAETTNPIATFWRSIRHSVSGYTAVSSAGHSVLIQGGGEIWREFRNVLLLNWTPWLFAGALVVMGVFHLVVGGDKLEEQRTGEMIERYSLFDRALHWYTALLFLVMAITGLAMLFGRPGLLPLFGHAAVAAFLSGVKLVHNWGGPLFLAGVVLEFIFWVRNNIIHKRDLLWLRNMGGMIGSGPRPPTGKINGGEKAWFWVMILMSIIVGATGVILDFPIWEQSRLTMQVSHAIHASAAVLFITFSFGHMYMGTMGSEGALEGMWHGKVDKAWAKQHADLWLEEVENRQ